MSISWDFSGIGKSISDLFSDPAGSWDKFLHGVSTDVNKQIAGENLDFQRERAAIEDERYADETAYNRAFAENERAYNRALQQQLFEREDTAYLRQAQQLSQLGINPLSQQLNGAGAGQVVSSGAAPVASTRSAEAPYNDFKMESAGPAQALAALSGLADTINGISTGTYQRDALALQNDKQFLENLQKAKGLGINYFGPGQTLQNGSYRNSTKEFYNKESGETWQDTLQAQDYEFSDLIPGRDKKREFNHKIISGKYDSDSPTISLIKDIGSLDFQDVAQNLLTNIAKAGNWANSNFKDFAKDMEHNAIMNFVKKFFAF